MQLHVRPFAGAGLEAPSKSFVCQATPCYRHLRAAYSFLPSSEHFWDERWPGSQRGMQVEMHGAIAPAKCLLGLGHQAPKLEARKHCVETSTVKIGPGPEPEQWGFDRGFFGTAQHESQFWPDATSTFYIESFWPFPSGQIKLAFLPPQAPHRLCFVHGDHGDATPASPM